MDTEGVDTGAPHKESGRPYVSFKGRYGYFWGKPKITKTLPRAILTQVVTDALAAYPPSAGSSIRSLSFQYDLRKDRWVATTLTRETGKLIYQIGIVTSSLLAVLFLIFMLIQVAYPLFQ